MKAISYTAARENLAATINEVCENRSRVIITRKRDQAVVMMSLEDYESLERDVLSSASLCECTTASSLHSVARNGKGSRV
ncbi:MAG: type II toxin-antitoxin system Phd/YefM family antitoxin [Verrucomicrobiota bacterium]